MDKLTAQQRHKNMAAIHSKDTKPEMIVRSGFWGATERLRRVLRNGSAAAAEPTRGVQEHNAR